MWPPPKPKIRRSNEGVQNKIPKGAKRTCQTHLPAPAAGRTNSIHFLNFASGATTEILQIDKPVDLGLAVSPDGHNLLFTQIDYVGQDLMLVEDFK